MSYRKLLIRAVTFLGGIYFFLEFVLPARVAGIRIDQYHDQISLGFVAVGAMALGLGLINLLMVHGSRLVLKRKGWPYSAALLSGLFLMVAITCSDWRGTSAIAGSVNRVFVLRDFSQRIAADAAAKNIDVPPADVRTLALLETLDKLLAEIALAVKETERLAVKNTDAARRIVVLAERVRSSELQIRTTMQEPSVPRPPSDWYERLAAQLGELAGVWSDLSNFRYGTSTAKHLYDLLYDGLYVPLGAAMFSLLGFYIATAAYRAFRVRSAESAFMMAAALVVMLGQIPFGIWIWQEFPEVRTWLLRIPSAAAFRAIEIGASVAGLIMAFRMWFSIESETFSGRKE